MESTESTDNDCTQPEQRAVVRRKSRHDSRSGDLEYQSEQVPIEKRVKEGIQPTIRAHGSPNAEIMEPSEEFDSVTDTSSSTEKRKRLCRPSSNSSYFIEVYTDSSLTIQ